LKHQEDADMGTTRSVARPEPKRNHAADLEAVGALPDLYAEAFNSNDAKAVAAFYTEDAVLMPPRIPAVQGRQAIETMFVGYFKQHAAKIKHTALDTQGPGAWAYDRGKIREVDTSRSGQPLEQSLKHLAILKRQAGGAWKIHVDIDNSNLNAAM
jgi:uncharacterized protein (TIGR02246 family)